MDTNSPRTLRTETLTRSVVKTVSYRLIILIMDFTSIYLFTGKLKVAVGFTIVSNVYTTVGYFFHERIWDRIKWGRMIALGPGPHQS